jgi:hypothetical protein
MHIAVILNVVIPSVIILYVVVLVKGIFYSYKLSFKILQSTIRECLPLAANSAQASHLGESWCFVTASEVAKRKGKVRLG